MTIRKANATAQNPDPYLRVSPVGEAVPIGAAVGADSWTLTSALPDLHPAIHDEIDAGHVRALVGHQEQRCIGDVLRLSKAAEERPAAHLATERVVLELPSCRVGLDETGRYRVDANAVLASLQCELASHPDDRRLVGRMGERRQQLETERTVERRHVQDDAAAVLQMRPRSAC